MARAGEGECARRRVARIARWRRGLLCSLLVWVALAIATDPLTAQTDGAQQAAQQAAQEAIRRLDLQTELPHDQTPQPSDWHFGIPPEVAWIVVAIAVGFLLYAFRDLVPAWRADANAAAEEETAAEESGTPAVILEAADELAAQGRFVEAMHVLLLHGLVHIRQRLDLQFSDSLTSREILVNRDLPDAARRSLRDVVARVELTYFGFRPAGPEDYTACRESFNALERALHAGATA
jgi:hypothetical protein